MSSSLNVLVTRPAGQASALARGLVERGYIAFEQPLLELHELQATEPGSEQHLEHLNSYQHLIFISGNAVRFGLAKISQRWPQFPDGVRVYAIGKKTAALLREYNLEPVSIGGGVPAVSGQSPMTSESLLSTEQLQQIDGQNVLIVKGLGGRNTLREGLSARGAKVDEFACYQRSCPALKPGELAYKISSCQIDILLFSSGEGFCNMLTLLSPAETINLYAMPLIVPSARVARLARDAGFTAVYEAKNATDDAMLEAVEQLQL